MDKKDKYTGVNCGTAEREVDCNTQLCAPNTPTISNPTKGNWTNSNFKLNVSTTTVASNIGYWYYSYDNKNWTKYTDSKGKNSYETPDISDERNGTIYIKVCNKEFNEDNLEASKCSQSSTPIKIDKIPPKSPYFKKFKNSDKSDWTQSGYRYHENLTYDETIDVNIYIGSRGTFFFDDEISSTDNTGGSGIKEERVLWTFTGTNTDQAYQCN